MQAARIAQCDIAAMVHPMRHSAHADELNLQLQNEQQLY